MRVVGGVCEGSVRVVGGVCDTVKTRLSSS